MTKTKARQKADWLAELLGYQYCVVKYFYGYDAQPLSSTIPDKDIYYVTATKVMMQTT